MTSLGSQPGPLGTGTGLGLCLYAKRSQPQLNTQEQSLGESSLCLVSLAVLPLPEAAVGRRQVLQGEVDLVRGAERQRDPCAGGADQRGRRAYPGLVQREQAFWLGYSDRRSD